MHLRICIASFLVLLSGCGSSIPTPWSERRGGEVVVGNQRKAAPESNAVTDRVGQVSGSPERDDLPDVPLDYPELFQAGQIDQCPAGTELDEERKGQLRQHCTLPDGTRHGPYISWYRKDQIKEVGAYRNGHRHGTVRTFDLDGVERNTMQWVNGQIVSGKAHVRDADAAP